MNKVTFWQEKELKMYHFGINPEDIRAVAEHKCNHIFFNTPLIEVVCEELPQKQKRFVRNLTRSPKDNQQSSTSKPLDADIETKIMSILHFELAKAKNIICELVPSNFEILRAEMIDEINRRCTLFKFDNILNEDIPLKMVTIENDVKNLNGKLKEFDQIINDLKNELPLLIAQFKNEILKVFSTL